MNLPSLDPLRVELFDHVLLQFLTRMELLRGSGIDELSSCGPSVDFGTIDTGMAIPDRHRPFSKWRATSIITKQQIIFRLTHLIRQTMDRLAIVSLPDPQCKR
jgi:hypothetical protein